MGENRTQALCGRVCLVTGATSGIGEATARGLAALGATVFVHGRDAAKGERTVAQIKRSTGNTDVRWVQGDLASLREVRRLANEIEGNVARVDVLVLNAGVACSHRTTSPDGYETTFAVNHLAPFLLTHQLSHSLARSAEGRIIIVSSEAHRGARLDFDNLMLENGYGQLKAYSRSKLANLLFMRALARRLHGTAVTSNALHPGVVSTGIFREAPAILRGLLGTIGRLFLLSPEQGARTSLYLATAAAVTGRTGEYYIRSKPARPSDAALDDAAAERLWKVSAQLVDVPQEWS